MSYADLVEGDRELGLVGHTGIGAALGDDFAGGGQRQLVEREARRSAQTYFQAAKLKIP